MPQVRSEGIILKIVNWKENSRIVTFFTDNAGKQSIIDRGGRSIRSKRGRLQSFTRLEVGYFKSEKSGAGYLSDVEPLEQFGFEKEGTLGRLAFASAAIEILNDLLAEDEPHPELYHLTVQFLRLADSSPKGGLIALFIAYFLKTLSYLGYRPNFAGCVACGKGKDEAMLKNGGNGERFFLFSPERGGIVCPSCQMMGEYYIRLQIKHQEMIYSLQTASLVEAAGVKVRMDNGDEMLNLLTAFFRYQTEAKELKSLKFLEKLKRTSL